MKVLAVTFSYPNPEFTQGAPTLCPWLDISHGMAKWFTWQGCAINQHKSPGTTLVGSPAGWVPESQLNGINPMEPQASGKQYMRGCVPVESQWSQCLHESQTMTPIQGMECQGWRVLWVKGRTGPLSWLSPCLEISPLLFLILFVFFLCLGEWKSGYTLLSE